MFGDMTTGGSDTKTISNIPYANYSIIVYSKFFADDVQSFDVGGATQSISNFVGVGSDSTVQNNRELPQDFDSASWSNGVFADGVHYTTFTGLTASSITLTHGSMAGFQIVESSVVPEPTSLAVLGLGSVGMLFRRRRTA